MKKAIVFIGLLLATFQLWSQNQLGAVPDDQRNIDRQHVFMSQSFHARGRNNIHGPQGQLLTEAQYSGATIAGASVYPSSYSLAVPPIGNQLSQGSCVPWSVAYYNRSIAQYYATGASSYSTASNIFSPKWMYDQIKNGGCQGGTSLIAALNFLVNNGDVLWDTSPYADTGCSSVPTALQQAEAANYKIQSYSMVVASDTLAIKSAISANVPLSFTFSPDSIFYNLGNNQVWSVRGGPSYGAHCIILVGWDDSKHAWKVANQWGTGWGTSGYGYIDYDFFITQVYDMYGLNLGAPPPPPQNLSPIANAGLDQSYPDDSTVTLVGTASSDPDGYIASYSWSVVSGPNSPTITNSTSAVASVAGSATIPGTYVFRLTVTDDQGATSTDDVTITVTAVANDTYTVTATKVSRKGTNKDVVTWNNVTTTTPISATLQVSYTARAAVSPGTWQTLYNIIPYTPCGGTTGCPFPAFSNVLTKTQSNKQTRWYREVILTSTGTTTTSNTVSAQ